VLLLGVGSIIIIMPRESQVVTPNPERSTLIKSTDLRGLSELRFDFELGHPFKPFEQLMGVLPSASRDEIPLAYRVCTPNYSVCLYKHKGFQDLMTDATSPIIDFYPTSFDQDMNGKKQDWEAVVKIPFIEEGRLLRAMRSMSIDHITELKASFS
jgi:5'-3' exoribonuclease 1